jgi:hypothetical protein
VSSEQLFDVTVSYPYEGDTTHFNQTAKEVRDYLRWKEHNFDDIRISPSKPQWEPHEWLAEFGWEDLT